MNNHNQNSTEPARLARTVSRLLLGTAILLACGCQTPRSSWLAPFAGSMAGVQETCDNCTISRRYAKSVEPRELAKPKTEKFSRAASPAQMADDQGVATADYQEPAESGKGTLPQPAPAMESVPQMQPVPGTGSYSLQGQRQQPALAGLPLQNGYATPFAPAGFPNPSPRSAIEMVVELSTEIAALREHLDSLQRDFRRLAAENSELRSVRDELESRLSRLESELSESASRENILRGQFHELNSRMQAWYQRRNDQIRELNRIIDLLESQLRDSGTGQVGQQPNPFREGQVGAAPAGSDG